MRCHRFESSAPRPRHPLPTRAKAHQTIRENAEGRPDRRDRHLVAHAFDARRLELLGDPKPVAEDLWYDPGVTALTSLSISSTGTLVFRTGGQEVSVLSWFDRRGRLRPSGSGPLQGFG